MRYTKFDIENFKGIREASIVLGKLDTARVFTFVGLNEGGKTTVLEAIHAFKPDSDAGVVVGGEQNTYRLLRNAVPRSQISDFDGNISVTAHIDATHSDIQKIVDCLLEKGITVDRSTLRQSFKFRRYVTFENGEPKNNFYNISMSIKVKSGRQKAFREPNDEQMRAFRDVIFSLVPSIAYFPTFVFNFPDRIYLSSRNDDETNAFYRQLFQDILDYGGRGHTIEEHILQRIHKKEYIHPWVAFLGAFSRGKESDQIDQVMDHAAQTVTSVVYESWNKIFGEKTRDRDIIISWAPDEGLSRENENGQMVAADHHDLYIQFRVKDGIDRFDLGNV